MVDSLIDPAAAQMPNYAGTSLINYIDISSQIGPGYLLRSEPFRTCLVLRMKINMMNMTTGLFNTTHYLWKRTVLVQNKCKQPGKHIIIINNVSEIRAGSQNPPPEPSTF